MAWIESHQELGGNPKVRKLARRLNISIPTAVGHLHFLWWWALDYADDGDLSRHDDEDIAIGAMWEGEPSLFVDAMCEVGWIDRDDRGRHVHDWWDYAGRLVQRRKANVQRMRETRAANVQNTCRAREQESDARAGATQPNPTEPDPTKTQSPNGLPASGSLSRKRRLSPSEKIAVETFEQLKPHLAQGKFPLVEGYEAVFEKSWERAAQAEDADPIQTAVAVLAAFFEAYLERAPGRADWPKLNHLVKDFGIDAVHGLHEAMAKEDVEDWYPYARGVCKRRIAT